MRDIPCSHLMKQFPSEHPESAQNSMSLFPLRPERLVGREIPGRPKGVLPGSPTELARADRDDDAVKGEDRENGSQNLKLVIHRESIQPSQ